MTSLPAAIQKLWQKKSIGLKKGELMDKQTLSVLMKLLDFENTGQNWAVNLQSMLHCRMWAEPSANEQQRLGQLFCPVP